LTAAALNTINFFDLHLFSDLNRSSRTMFFTLAAFDASVVIDG
jgi:hypothetical protein